MKTDSSAAQFDLEESDDHKYIIFYLGRELYATPLTLTREVVEVIPTKPVPNTVESFLGVCNLRGQIVGVIDLETRFGIAGDNAGSKVYFVFDSGDRVIAAQAGRIVSVDLIPPENVETKPAIVSNIPQKHIIGIAKHNKNLITIINFRSLLSQEDLCNISTSNKSAA